MNNRPYAFIVKYSLGLTSLLVVGCTPQLDLKNYITHQSGEEVSLLDVEKLIQHRWEELQFSGQTEYRVISLDDKPVLWARGRESASALIRFVEFDAERCPILNWSWRVDDLQQGADLRIKPREDVAASIYLLFGDPGLLSDPDPVPTIRYVWTNSSSEAGSIIDSPYLPGIVKSFVIRAGNDHLGEWTTESRNIYEDYQRAFGSTPTENIQAILLFTDNDQTRQVVNAGYAWMKAICQ